MGIKIPGVITVRTTSSRLPNKCLLNFGDSNTKLIEHIVERSISYDIEPILCTSIDPSDDILEEIAKKMKINFFRGSLDNKLNRWFECTKKFNLKNFHSVDADDPFFDGERMHESFELLVKNKYDFVKPSNYSDSGAATEGFSVDANFLKKANETFYSEKDTEMVVYYFEKLSENYTILKDPKYKMEKETPRLTLDYWEDYIALNAIKLLTEQNKHFKEREKIEEFYLQAKILKVNQHMNELWKKKQLSKKI
tara:strand:+ start:283 stop:1038 length:756 start_codon:yes stop_codon:yes gene_type:complete